MPCSSGAIELMGSVHEPESSSTQRASSPQPSPPEEEREKTDKLAGSWFQCASKNVEAPHERVTRCYLVGYCQIEWCDVVIHENDVLSGFWRTRMEVLIIEQQRRGDRRELQLDRSIGLARSLGAHLNDNELQVPRSGFVHAMPIQLRVPLVAGTFGGKAPDRIGGAFEHTGT